MVELATARPQSTSPVGGGVGTSRKHWFSNARTGAVTLVVWLSALGAVPASAQDGQDELGTWLIYNGTLRFSDRWSVFTETQLRLYQVSSDPQEAFVRVAGHYNLSSLALVGLGYSRIHSWPFIDTSDADVAEDRIYQQFAIKHSWGRAGFEHRYRLEERWIQRSGEDEFSFRARYRLQVTAPLNRSSMESGAYFINAYDEIFINFDTIRAFDQNRLYVAGGLQFTTASNLQLGVLWQVKESADFFRLQVFYTHNFDFR